MHKILPKLSFLPSIFILVFSYLFFSMEFHPLLNSDMALSPLMATHYSWPSDIYCWGQNRGGTLIPMLGHWFVKGFGISPIRAVSIAHWLILTLGFYFGNQLYAKNWQKWLLALVLFWPNTHFFAFTVYPFGIQFSFFLMQLAFWKKFFYAKTIGHKLLGMGLFFITGLTSLWVSDLMVVSQLAIVIGGIHFDWIKTKTLKISSYIPFFALVLVEMTLIYQAKKMVKEDVFYDEKWLSSLPQVGESANTIITSLWNTITFQNGDILVGLLVISLAFGLLVINLKQPHAKTQTEPRLEKLTLLWHSLLLFLSILGSYWAYKNQMGIRYFSLVMASIGMLYIYAIENMHYTKPRQLLYLLPFVFHLCSGISLASKGTPIQDKIKGLKNSHIGIIAEYHHAYIMASFNKTNMVATPHDKSTVRNVDYAGKVFSKDSIIVIGDLWMEHFPDTLTQFGQTLLKKGPSFRFLDNHAQLYERMPIKISHRSILVKNKKISWEGDGWCSERIEKNASHLIYGPYQNLCAGEYEIAFTLKAKQLEFPDQPAVQFSITDQKGTAIYFQDYIATDSIIHIKHPMALKKWTRGVEFRIKALQPMDFCLDNFLLIEKRIDG